MWDVLKDYPAARVRLEAIAAKKLEKYKKVPLEKGKWCIKQKYVFVLLICITNIFFKSIWKKIIRVFNQEKPMP